MGAGSVEAQFLSAIPRGRRCLSPFSQRGASPHFPFAAYPPITVSTPKDLLGRLPLHVS